LLSSNLQVFLQSGTGTDQFYWTGFTGDTQVGTITLSTSTLTTTWQRFVFTGTVPSTATQLNIQINKTSTGTAGATDYAEITGVQIDLGTYTASTAPTFRRAGGTIQGELAACQRYYYRISDPAGTQLYTAITVLHDNSAQNSTTVYGVTSNPVPMRTTPTSTEFSNIAFHRNDGTLFAISAVTIDPATDSILGSMYNLTVSGVTAGNVGRVLGNNNSGAYFGVSAEL
jgi:hypothetical protein